MAGKAKKTSAGGNLAGAPEFSDLVVRNGEILSQLSAMHALEGAHVKSDPDGAWALGAWRERLLAGLANNTALTLTAGNVDTGAPKPARVGAMWTLLAACVDDLDAAATAPNKRRLKGFLLHVAWHEGLRLTARKQGGGGPARSFFQFEAHRAKDALEYAAQEGLVPKLATAAGKTQAQITAAAADLPSFGTPNAPNFPAGNLIQDLLISNDLFGVYLARIAFKKIPQAIPASNPDQATYWYQHWKVSGGDPVALKKTFTDEADEVDALIPP